MAAHVTTHVISMGRRSCSVCLKTIKYAPVVFISAVIGWSYYAYVVELCFKTVESIGLTAFLIIVYHALLVLFLWSYYMTVVTPVALVPAQFRLSPADLTTFETTEDNRQQIQLLENHMVCHALPLHTRSATGALRYCEKCRHIKPDRCHHCSVCSQCVLKMDHHCPWVNNCIGFSNYKFFLLFLSYAFLYCVYIALSSLNYFILFWRDSLVGVGKFHVMFLFFVSAMFSVSLVSLLGYHVYLVLCNQSTLETSRAPIFQSGPDRKGFSMGRLNNLCEVFGDNKLLWVLPVFTSFGDGVCFPTRYQSLPTNANYGTTSGVSDRASLGDGVNFPLRHQDLDTDGLMGRQRWLEAEQLDDSEAQQGEVRVQIE